MKPRRLSSEELLLAILAFVLLLVVVAAVPDLRSTFAIDHWRSDNGQEVGRITQAGDFNLLGVLNAGGLVRSTNGFSIYSNSPSAWPTSATAPGAAFLGNSNGVIYLLTSTITNTAWAATNKIAP